MSSTVFILGGFGYIGFNLAKILNSNNYNVVIIDVMGSKVPMDFNCCYYCCDIRNVAYMITLVNRHKPDCFIWCVDLIPCNNLYYDVCINGLTSIINILNVNNIKQFIYLSSAEIYGVSEYTDENMIGAPFTTEGKTKLLSEDIIVNQYAYDYFILRVSNVYGKIIPNIPNYKNHIINQIELFKNNIIEKIGVTNIISDYIHIEDLIVIISKCLYKLNVYDINKTILNVGTENTKSDIRIFNYFYCNKEKPPLYGHRNAEVIVNTLNCNKCKYVLLWEPKHKLI
jgi:UDP-glucose 4-epimerase